MDRAALQRVVVLTGAGISAESGIATFRASDGLWEKHRVEDVASPEGFLRDPVLVHRFYNARRAAHEGRMSADAVALDPETHADISPPSPAKPNAAHLALAEFERAFTARGPEYDFLLVTQNIDALHERAGSERLLHMHGELLRVRCQITGDVHEWTGDCFVETPCPCCRKAGTLRPHVVWFGEVPLFMERIADALSRCDLFISIGTSGHVYPAAGFHQIAQNSGAETVELNLEPSENARWFSRGNYGLASEVVPTFLGELIP